MTYRARCALVSRRCGRDERRASPHRRNPAAGSLTPGPTSAADRPALREVIGVERNSAHLKAGVHVHVEPHRSLAYVSVNFSDSAPQDRLTAAVRKAGGVVQSTCIQRPSGQGGARALLAVDITDAANRVQGVTHELHGDLELDQTFESMAWQGKGDQVCSIRFGPAT